MRSWLAARRPTAADCELPGHARTGLRLRRFVRDSANRQRQGHPAGRGKRRCGDRTGSRQQRRAPVADPIVGGLRPRRPPAWWSGAVRPTAAAYTTRCSRPAAALKALDIKTGKVDWNAAINADQRGQAGPASAIPGVVFTGGWDGILRAVDAGGKVIWTFNAVRDFETVNGVPAKGGSFGSAGPVVASGMVFAASGYPGTLRGTPGNVLLAFGVE